MTDPQTFYNREDLWSIAQETYGDRVQQMQTYYTTLRLPGESGTEFASILPFTPSGQNRNNMLAWLVARSDAPNYGQVIVYRFPQGKLVFGPQQIEARINQEPAISSQITLWSQQGSQVLRGNLLVIPLEDAVLYVEPLYIQAAEQPAAGAQARHRRLDRLGGHERPPGYRARGVGPGAVWRSADRRGRLAAAQPAPTARRRRRPRRKRRRASPAPPPTWPPPRAITCAPPKPPPGKATGPPTAPRWPRSTSCSISSPRPPAASVKPPFGGPQPDGDQKRTPRWGGLIVWRLPLFRAAENYRLREKVPSNAR